MGLRIALRTRRIALIVCIAIQFVLLYLSSSVLAGYPGYFYGGRFVASQLVSLVAAVVGIAIFVLPSIIGLLCRRWQEALVLALLPWWLTVIAHAGTFLGPYFVGAPTLDHPFWLDPARVGLLLLSLALFAALGVLGWFAGAALAARQVPMPAG